MIMFTIVNSITITTVMPICQAQNFGDSDRDYSNRESFVVMVTIAVGRVIFIWMGMGKWWVTIEKGRLYFNDLVTCIMSDDKSEVAAANGWSATTAFFPSVRIVPGSRRFVLGFFNKKPRFPFSSFEKSPRVLKRSWLDLRGYEIPSLVTRPYPKK
jgi:hypothetical protein